MALNVFIPMANNIVSEVNPFENEQAIAEHLASQEGN